jgi:N-acetylmuramoyl-L-alanine amidase
MGYKTSVILPAVFLSASMALAQSSTLSQQASTQFRQAEKAEAALNEKSEAMRTQAEYLKVIRAYERVYLITPHSGWADNALTTIARLYEEIKDSKNAIKTLRFLVHEYPQTPLRDMAERDIVRLSGTAVASEVLPKSTASIENIRYWEEDRSVRVVVDITGDARFTTGEAKSPDRFFLDIAPARLNSTLLGKEWPIESKVFQKIRVAQYDGSTVRIVLDGSTSKGVVASALKDPNRIIIDVAGNSGPSVPRSISGAVPVPVVPPSIPAAILAAPIATASTTPSSGASSPAASPVTGSAAPAPVPPPVPAPAPAQPPPVAAAPPSTPNAEPIRVAVEAKPSNRSLIRSLGLKMSRVVIDAGHGGHDSGSIGPTGYTEKELVLDVSKRLKALIEAEMEAEVVMTRTEDVYVPLESRTQIANKEEADLFISIHANSSKVKSVRGVETFFLNFNTQSRDALETAARENAATERNIHDLHDMVEKITLNDKVDESRELAGHIQSSMSKRSNAGTNRGVKQAPFVVLIGASMPSVLAEVSFISNATEERLLKTPAYRQQIAESLFRGIKSYAETLANIKTARSQEKN